MNEYSSHPAALAESLWRNRELTGSLVRREIEARYRGSLLGGLWALLNPILMLAAYTFVFGVVLKQRWSGAGTTGHFALALFAGMLVFNLFADCINRAPNLVAARPNYVKKINFPLEILPMVDMIAALCHFGIGLVVWMLFHMVLVGLPRPSVFYVPVILLPLLLTMLGLAWIVAALGVYLRDTGQFVVALTSLLLFLSPVFYPLAALPEPWKVLLECSPLAHAIEQVRGALLLGVAPEVSAWLAFMLAGGIIAGTGFAFFQRTRKGFGDVL